MLTPIFSSFPLLQAENPLYKVFHDTTLYGDGTKAKPLRVVSAGGGSWGSITGTLTDQTDLQTALNAKESISNKGAINGYASLDGSGLVPSSQLPSYVDDILEFADLASLPVTGVTGKIYVTLDSNKSYRWSGSIYVEVSPTLPAGSNTQIQFNNSGVLGGSANLTWDGTSHLASTYIVPALGGIGLSGAPDTKITFENTGLPVNGIIYNVTNSSNCHKWQLASAEVMRLNSVGLGIGVTASTGKLQVTDTVLAGSAALAGSLLDLAQTWNTSGNPTAIKLNVTNSASGAASLLLDLQASTVSQFKVSKIGATTIGTSSTVAQLSVKGDNTNPVANFEGSTGTNGWQIDAAGTSLIPKVNETNTLGALNSRVATVYASEMRGGASSNWVYGATSGGYDGYFQIRQNHDFNGKAGNWLFNYSTTNGNNATSGTGAHVGIIGNFKPTSGTAVYSDFAITSVINQTGGANGKVRGIYIAPTLTAVGTGGFSGLEIAANGTASSSSILSTGTWFSGGTSTTTKPHWLIEPTGTTSTAWSTSGTGLGINAATGFAGNLIDCQLNGTSNFKVTSSGGFTANGIALLYGATVEFAAGSPIRWAGRSTILSPSDGVVELTNQAQTDFSRLQFGGTSSSFPALKRSGTGIVVRLADDSANADITAAGGTFSNSIALASGNYLAWTSRSQIFSPANGNILMQNAVNTDFDRLQLGGTTSSYPAWKRSSATLQARLADDSDFAKVNVKQLLVDATNTASGTTGDQTINKAAGRVNFGNGDSTITITNSLVTSSSLIFAMLQQDADPNIHITNIRNAGGSFTIGLNQPAAAEVPVAFFVVN